MATDEPRKLDEAPAPGGVYVVSDHIVDATGAVLEGWSLDSDGTATKDVLAPPPPSGP